jgi:hypothetical protein
VTISVLVLAGKRGDAVGALEQVLEGYERKQNLVRAERVRARLAEVRCALPCRELEKVTISPGYALDRHGEEIVVSRSVAVDLSGHAADTTVYVAVR